MVAIVTRREHVRSPGSTARPCVSAAAWLPVLHRLPMGFPSDAVALTVDDGPAATTPALLDILAAYRARATFFLLGERAAADPGMVEEIVGRGHAVYAHGFSHTRFTFLSTEQIIDEMSRTEEVLSRFRPTPARYLVRLPHGSGHDHPRIHRALRKWHRGAQIARWSISTQDYELSRFEHDDVIDLEVEHVIDREIEKRLRQAFEDSSHIGRSIILLHEQPFGIASPDAAGHCLAMALRLVETLFVRHYAMVPLPPSFRPSFLSRFVYVRRNDLQLGHPWGQPA